MNDFIIIVTSLVIGALLFTFILAKIINPSEKIEICIQEEIYMNSIEKCKVTKRMDNTICFEGKYLGQTMFKDAYNISCENETITIPKSFVIFKKIY